MNAGIAQPFLQNDNSAGFTSTSITSGLSSSDMPAELPFPSDWINTVLGGPATHFVTFTLPPQWPSDPIKRDQTLAYALKVTNRKTPRSIRVGLIGHWEIGPIAGLQHLHGLTKASDETLAVMGKAWVSTLVRFNSGAMKKALSQDLFWEANVQSAIKAFRYSAKHGEQPTVIQAPRSNRLGT